MESWSPDSRNLPLLLVIAALFITPFVLAWKRFSARDNKGIHDGTNRAVLIAGVMAVVLSVVPASAKERHEVRFGDWTYSYKVDAMTDSIVDRQADTDGRVFIDGRDTYTARLVFQMCVNDDAMVVLQGYVPAPPHPEVKMDTLQAIEVRYSFDRQPASPWQEWQGNPSWFGEAVIHWSLVTMTFYLESGFVDQARSAEQVRFRFRKSQGLPERDLVFSMKGFTRASSGVCSPY